MVGGEQGVGEDLRQRAGALLVLAQIGRRDLLDVEVPRVEGGIEGVGGLLFLPGPLIGVEGGEDDQVRQAGGLPPTWAQIGSGWPPTHSCSAGSMTKAQLPQQVPVQVLVPSQLGGEALVRGVAGMLLKEGRGEARQALGRGILVRLGFDSAWARSCSQSLIRDWKTWAKKWWL